MGRSEVVAGSETGKGAGRDGSVVGQEEGNESKTETGTEKLSRADEEAAGSGG